MSIEPLFAVLGSLQPSKRASKDFEISGDSLLCVCIDMRLIFWPSEKPQGEKLKIQEKFQTQARNSFFSIFEKVCVKISRI